MGIAVGGEDGGEAGITFSGMGSVCSCIFLGAPL